MLMRRHVHLRYLTTKLSKVVVHSSFTEHMMKYLGMTNGATQNYKYIVMSSRRSHSHMLNKLSKLATTNPLDRGNNED